MVTITNKYIEILICREKKTKLHWIWGGLLTKDSNFIVKRKKKKHLDSLPWPGMSRETKLLLQISSFQCSLISMIWFDMYSINRSPFTKILSKNVLKYSERREAASSGCGRVTEPVFLPQSQLALGEMHMPCSSRGTSRKLVLDFCLIFLLDSSSPGLLNRCLSPLSLSPVGWFWWMALAHPQMWCCCRADGWQILGFGLHPEYSAQEAVRLVWTVRQMTGLCV